MQLCANHFTVLIWILLIGLICFWSAIRSNIWNMPSDSDDFLLKLHSFNSVTTYIVYTLKYHVIEKVQIVSLMKNILRNSVWKPTNIYLLGSYVYPWEITRKKYNSLVYQLRKGAHHKLTSNCSERVTSTRLRGFEH